MKLMSRLLPPREALIPLILVVLLQLADAALTYIGISRYGMSAEANGFARWLFEAIGVETGIRFAKAWAIPWALLLAYTAKSKRQRISMRALWGLVPLIFFLVVVNWSLILMLYHVVD